MTSRQQAVVLLVAWALLTALTVAGVVLHPDRLPTVLAACGATVLTVLLLRRP